MSKNITLNDQELAALRALHEAGGSALITALPDELRNGFVDLYVKELVAFEKDGRKTVITITDKGRALAVDLFTPPLTMPTDEGAVKAWLQARGLWAAWDKVQVDGASYIYVFLNKGYSVRRCMVKGGGQGFCVTFPRSIVEPEAADEFRADFDRACAIARALNASVGKGE